MAFDDHLSPVFVKELRQALRGRAFAWVFSISLGLAAVISVTGLLESSHVRGSSIALPALLSLATALIVYVPFHAQQSMRQEDSESARELLSLTPLGPWRVALGKLAASTVVAGLILAAFAPFVTVMALLPAADTLGILLFLLQVAGFSLALAALGIGLGGVGRQRFARGGSGVILGFAALMVLGFQFELAERALVRGSGIGVQRALLVAWLIVAPLAPLALGLAASGLSYDDREPSSGLRIAWGSFVGLLALAVAVALPWMGADDMEDILGFGALGILFGSVPAAILTAESPQPDRETEARLAGRRARPFAALFAYGRGRALALNLALGALLAGATMIGLFQLRVGGSGAMLVEPFGRQFWQALLALAGAQGVSLTFSILPAMMVAPHHPTPLERRKARLLGTISLLVASFVLPVLLLIGSGGNVTPDELVVSPLSAVLSAVFDRGNGEAVLLWVVLGVFALLIGLALPGAGLRRAPGGANSDVNL